MAQSNVQFGYWNIRGGVRGQINRYLLKYAGVDFTDKRYSPEEWAVDKGTLVENIPYIIVGDFKLTESKAVSVYICDKFAPQLLGSTPEARAKIIMMQQVIVDAIIPTAMIAFGSPDVEPLRAKCMEGFAKIVPYLGSKQFLEGNEVSMNDFSLFEFIEMTNILNENESLYDTYPALRAFHQSMLALPKFGEYFNSAECMKGPILTPGICKIEQWTRE